MLYFLGVVREGQNYGPVDHICTKQVKYIRVCGHETTMTCKIAFEQAPIIVSSITDQALKKYHLDNILLL